MHDFKIGQKVTSKRYPIDNGICIPYRCGEIGCVVDCIGSSGQGDMYTVQFKDGARIRFWYWELRAVPATRWDRFKAWVYRLWQRL